MISLAACAFILLQAPVASPTPAVPGPPEPSGPSVVFETTLGTIKIGLFPDKSPKSVANFLDYVRSGHYAGTTFHRVMPGFVIQGGGLDENMVEKPTRAPIRNEARNAVRNQRATLSMARTDDPDSATSQFFVNLKDNHRLDFGVGGAGYAVFGIVTEGMDVVDAIAATRTTTKGPFEGVPVTPIFIKAARVVGEGTPAKPPAARPATGAKPSGKPAPKASPAAK